MNDSTSQLKSGGEVHGNEGKLVCVTGASGYIGCHVVKALLERSYRVRATVRDPSDSRKVSHLKSLVAKPKFPLDIAKGDLVSSGSFDEAMEGCEFVCHVASPVHMASKNPERELITPAVEGTRNVLASVKRAGTVQRVVLTSSIAAIADLAQRRAVAFTEADWNSSSTLESSPYELSKTLAEKEAWSIFEAIAEEERFDLITINPSFVLGPVFAESHLRSSPSIVLDIMKRAYPGCPKLFFNVVAGRDVGLAHARALEVPGAKGRYLLNSKGLWMQEMAQVVAGAFPSHSIATNRLPGVALFMAALVNKDLSWARRHLGWAARFEGDRAPRELGFTYMSAEQSVIDTCQSIVDLGFA